MSDDEFIYLSHAATLRTDSAWDGYDEWVDRMLEEWASNVAEHLVAARKRDRLKRVLLRAKHHDPLGIWDELPAWASAGRQRLDEERRALHDRPAGAAPGPIAPRA